MTPCFTVAGFGVYAEIQLSQAVQLTQLWSQMSGSAATRRSSYKHHLLLWLSRMRKPENSRPRLRPCIWAPWPGLATSCSAPGATVCESAHNRTWGNLRMSVMKPIKCTAIFVVEPETAVQPSAMGPVLVAHTQRNPLAKHDTTFKQ